MRLSLFLILIVFSSHIRAQEFNQFDSEGKRHGKWQKTFEGTNLLRYKGQFHHGKEVGLFEFYKLINEESVLSATKKFSDSNSVAEVKFYSPKGNVISEGKMNGKNFIGKWMYYHKNSNDMMRTEFFDNNGLLQGEFNVYFKNGNLAEKSYYKNDKLDSLSTLFNQNGVVIKTYTYKDGKLNGPAKFFTNKGILVIDGQYKGDKKHGLWKYYEDGVLLHKKEFTRRSKNPFIKKAP